MNAKTRLAAVAAQFGGRRRAHPLPLELDASRSDLSSTTSISPALSPPPPSFSPPRPSDSNPFLCIRESSSHLFRFLMEVGPSSPQASPPPSKPSTPVPYPLFAPKRPSGSPKASYQVPGSSAPPAGPPAKKPRAKKTSAGPGASKDARQAKLAFAGSGGGLAAVRVPLEAEERNGGGPESSAGKAQGKGKGKVNHDDSELAEVRTMDKTSKPRATKRSKMNAVKSDSELGLSLTAISVWACCMYDSDEVRLLLFHRERSRRVDGASTNHW